MRVMDLALQEDRPARSEIVAVLAACALLLVGVAKLDHSQASRENERAREALAERARESRTDPRAQVAAPAPPAARTESLGDRGPITIPIGGAWGAGTASAVSNGRPAAELEPAATGELRRILGPVPGAGTGRADLPSPPTPAVASGATVIGGDLLLFLLGGGGALMALAGALVLTRR